ncbi:MAG: putative baseplate assembly protein [Gammaproteobacteria bacterium]|nr:putative baseplate assembly protein [Gammaproteobacteria bacterium]MDH4311665.1 putative baseplate assembly protein [Gammaproteobacteria bacterium]
MALKDAMPVIDDRRYDDIVEEIKTRIARYTPEWRPDASAWTDYNESDPGITLAQLVAWLSEMLLYRMGKVPELNYLKFLEMLGIEPQAARPATVDVTFPVVDSTPAPYVDVPVRTQVSAPADDDGPPLVYETQRSLRALTATLQSVQAFDGSGHQDVSAENAGLQSFAPFGALASVDSALVLGFGYPAAYPKNKDEFPATTFDLAIVTPTGNERGAVATCGFQATPAYAPAKLQWEYWNGADWTRLDALKDETLALTRPGYVTLRTPTVGAMKRDYLGAYQNGPGRDPLFWIRARLVKAQYETPPEIVAVRANTVPALQAQTVYGEVLGGTDGTRQQHWRLANTPVIAGSVHIQIDDGTGATAWDVRSDLLDAEAGEKVLALAPSTGTLTSGDGVHGAIAVANAANPDANVVAVEYRYGGGARGNMPAGAIRSVLTAVDHIDSGKVANLFAAVGGVDEEPLARAKERARRSIRAQDRAVTAADFELLATQAADIARARTLPLFHPEFPTVKVPGAVTVIVVPNARRIRGQPFRPMPSDGLLRTVCAYLDSRRLVTTEVFVAAPSYQEIRVDAQIVSSPDADTAAVREAAEQAVTDYFDPIIGGDDGTGWGFGETVRYSKVYQRIFSVDGVDSIDGLTITLDGETYPECKDVPIATNALLCSGAHRLEVQLEPEEMSA